MNNYSDIKIGKLIHQLKIHQFCEEDGITLFLGAGCSLASSPRDISTWGIVKDIVQNHLGNDSEIPDTWTELYKLFVNLAWNGLGKKDKINLLKPYFNDLQPSEGYLAIKYLVENGYIQNIITTNFDPLIDTILEKIPHRKIVGKYDVKNDNNSQIVFIKAHGDLEYGGLRFSPYELQKLPLKLENIIRQLTRGIVIVVGYRGQDIGIMNALNTSDDHCVFWISPMKPEIYDGYNNDPIYHWMKKRNSEDNFIFGEFGDFNVLFPTLVKKITSSPNQDSQIIELWKNSFLYDTMSLSKRISLVFSIFLRIENELLSAYSWKIRAPYFAENSSSLLSVLINVCQDKILPQNSIANIENGIESLLLAFALDIFVQTQGYPIATQQYLENLQKKYELWPNAPKLNENFWRLLKKLFIEDSDNNPNFFEVILTFDLNKDFSYVLKKGEFSEIQSLFTMIRVVSLFQKTASEKANIKSKEYRAKIILEKNCRKINPSIQSTNITLEDMSPADDILLHQYLLDMYNPMQHVLGNRHTYLIDKVYIEYEINAKIDKELGLYDDFLQKSSDYSKIFLQYIDLKNFVFSEAINTLESFTLSMNSGLIMLGPSGSGKTTILGYWVKILQTDESFVALPFMGKEQRLMQRGVNVFSNWFSDSAKLDNINNLFYCRNQILILIYDALNEVPGDFNFLQDNYNDFINFIEILSKNKYNNIKVVLSLRTDSYLQLQQNKAKEPKPGVFYSTILEDGKNSPLYIIPSFTKEQALELLKKETTLKSKDLIAVYKRFFNILRTPFYIQLFGKTLNSFSTFGEKEYAIFSLKWYNVLLKNISEDEEEQKNLSDVVEAIIIIKYQHDGRNIFINELLRKLQTSDPLIMRNVLKLQEVGILTYDNISGQLDFSHDIYEQIFLTKYLTLLDYPEIFCSSIFEQQRNPSILTLALQDYLHIQKASDSENYFLIVLHFLSQGNTILMKILLKLVVKIQEESPISNFWNILFEKIDYNIGLACHSKALTLLLQEMNMALNNKQLFQVETLDSLFLVIYPNYNRNDIVTTKDQAFYEFIYAKYLYVFSYKFPKDVFRQAKIHCENAINLLAGDSNELSLYDDISFLYSVLLRYEGKLNEAVELLEKVLENQLKNFVPDKTCQTGLELGAIYRELTKFDDAMQLYNRIKKTCSLSPYWDARLKLNIGIIFKNRLQLKISDKTLEDKDYGNYSITENLFKFVYNYAATTDDILLQLEIQAELIELCAIAKHFNIEATKLARKYICEMEDTLKKYPIPLRQIQYYRMLARVEMMEEKYNESLQSLKKGYQLSITYDIPYRACDCCRKFAQIVLEHKQSDIVLLQEALVYIDYAINFYISLNAKSHLYFLEAKNQKNKLEDLLKKQSPV